jgi:hypothetical protein
MTSHMKDSKKMFEWIDKNTKEVLYFETNFHHDKDKELQNLKKHTNFKEYKYLGDSGDIPNSYHLFRCER